jgi:aminodeoxyfutalosine deaminase
MIWLDLGWTPGTASHNEDDSTMNGRPRSEDVASSQYVLHNAAWVVPISSPPISDGAVLVRDGTIMAVGTSRAMEAQATAHTRKIDHGYKALIPALVNAHTHLELSAFEGMITFPRESFPAWLKELMPLRRTVGVEDERKGFLEGKRQLTASGVVLCGDIANKVRPPFEVTGPVCGSHTFLEVLGFDRDSLESVIEPDVLRTLDSPMSHGVASLSLAAHACYSTSAGLIRQSKAWCRTRGAPFTIHVAEHIEEIEFLRDGTGFCLELLESLGRQVSHWTPPRMTPVRYLKELGVLDASTLLVHTVQMSEVDWEIVAASQCSVCFCPRSNRNLNVGRADMEKAFLLGIPVALGTDSLASNTDLSLFSEACYVLDQYTGLDPQAVLSMITQGGAMALQREDRYGSIGPGKVSALLAVALPRSSNSSKLMEIIIRQGKEGAWQWANSAMND